MDIFTPNFSLTRGSCESGANQLTLVRQIGLTRSTIVQLGAVDVLQKYPAHCFVEDSVFYFAVEFIYLLRYCHSKSGLQPQQQQRQKQKYKQQKQHMMLRLQPSSCVQVIIKRFRNKDDHWVSNSFHLDTLFIQYNHVISLFIGRFAEKAIAKRSRSR